MWFMKMVKMFYVKTYYVFAEIPYRSWFASNRYSCQRFTNRWVSIHFVFCFFVALSLYVELQFEIGPFLVQLQ